MNTNIERRGFRARPLTLLETMIVLLAACSIVIFVFTIGAKFVGRDTFDKLPAFLKDSYDALWSAGVVAGGALVGSVVETLSKRDRTGVNFALYVLATTLLIILLVFATVLVSRVTEKPQLGVPDGAREISLSNDTESPVQFVLQNRLGGFIQANIKGAYSVKDGIVSGKVADSDLRLFFPPAFPQAAGTLSLVSIHVCAVIVRNGYPITTQIPEVSIGANRVSINVATSAQGTHQIPDFEFSVDASNFEAFGPPYLCAFVEDLNGYKSINY